MINQQLIEYIKKSLEGGSKKEEIKNVLLSHGWPEKDVEEAFYLVESEGNLIPDFPSSPRLLSFQELWKKTFAFYKQKLFLLVPIVLIAFLVLEFLSLIIFKIISHYSINPFVYFLSIIFSFINISLYWFVNLALIYLVKESSENPRTSIFSVYYKSWQNFFNYFITKTIHAAIILFPFILMLFLGFSLIKRDFLAFYVVFTSILAFIITLIFALYFIFTDYVFVYENKKGVEALMRSKFYTSGLINKEIFPRLFLLGSCFVLIVLAVLFICFLTHSPASFLLNILNFFYFLPFSTIFICYLYLNVRPIKERSPILENVKEKSLFKILAAGGIILFLIMQFLIYSRIYSILTNKTEGKNIFQSLFFHRSLEERVKEVKQKSELDSLKNLLALYQLMEDEYPSSLEQLKDKLGKAGFSFSIIDPETNQPYHYEVLNGGKSYKLCSGWGTPRQICISPEITP